MQQQSSNQEKTESKSTGVICKSHRASVKAHRCVQHLKEEESDREMLNFL